MPNQFPSYPQNYFNYKSGGSFNPSAFTSASSSGAMPSGGEIPWVLQQYMNQRAMPTQSRDFQYSPQFGNTPFAGAESYLRKQLEDAIARGDKSRTSEIWRQLDDLGTVASTYGDPSKSINRFYDVAAGNLGQRQATDRARARSTAGAIAGSRGYVNPGASILGAGSQVANQYAPAFGQLEASRMGALSQAEQQVLQMLLQYLAQGQNRRGEQNLYNEANTPSVLDWINAIGNIGQGVAAAL